MEIVLGADGNLDCLRMSSMPEMSWLLMAAYLLINVIMLVNLLIALMAKSFDNIVEVQGQLYLYLFARQTSLWQQYPAVPPPFNLISVPYYVGSGLFALARSCSPSMLAGKTPSRHDGPAFQRSMTDLRLAHTPAFTLPVPWYSSEGLRDIIERFISEHSSEMVREDRFKHELFTHLGRQFGATEKRIERMETRLEKRLDV
jgi:hypothetical protein